MLQGLELLGLMWLETVLSTSVWSEGVTDF